MDSAHCLHLPLHLLLGKKCTLSCFYCSAKTEGGAWVTFTRMLLNRMNGLFPSLSSLFLSTGWARAYREKPDSRQHINYHLWPFDDNKIWQDILNFEMIRTNMVVASVRNPGVCWTREVVKNRPQTHTHAYTNATHAENKLIRLSGLGELATKSRWLFLRADNEI